MHPRVAGSFQLFQSLVCILQTQSGTVDRVRGPRSAGGFHAARIDGSPVTCSKLLFVVLPSRGDEVFCFVQIAGAQEEASRGQFSFGNLRPDRPVGPADEQPLVCQAGGVRGRIVSELAGVRKRDKRICIVLVLRPVQFSTERDRSAQALFGAFEAALLSQADADSLERRRIELSNTASSSSSAVASPRPAWGAGSIAQADLQRRAALRPPSPQNSEPAAPPPPSPRTHALRRFQQRFGDNVEFRSPSDVMGSQNSAGTIFDPKTQLHDADVLRRQMATQGWRGAPIDVVDQGGGTLVSADNTRLAVARELSRSENPAVAASFQQIPVRIHARSERVSPSTAGRFPTRTGQPVRSWGEAIDARTSAQGQGGRGRRVERGGTDRTALPERPRKSWHPTWHRAMQQAQPPPLPRPTPPASPRTSTSAPSKPN